MRTSLLLRVPILIAGLAASLASASPLTVSITPPAAPNDEGFKMGESRRPDGTTLTLDSRSLRLDGKPWMPVMGEFHFARYPASEWREELLKMKAGGVDIVATYVFWIHHEEIEGQWDWSGSRNLRRFIETAGDVGLKAIVRCGPWCHGEVRNGGQPDWLLHKGWRVRSNDTNYLAQVRILYGQIADQLKGQLWKDGGPVIGIQLENEFRGPAEHLLTLKAIAREAGFDVPLYTRTGWPQLRSPMPFGEIVPLYGVYAEGFWDRELTPMPGRYWAGFHFSTMRTDANIANEVLGRNAQDGPDVARYPYLTCEIGAGMMSSYHRRIRIDPADAESITLVKLGSGSASLGYYMYHGGVNPDGKLTTLMESQATGMWNDLPVKNYDFQTALGQYGQVRPQYHWLRRLHLFLHEWGSQLADMSVSLPDQRPTGKDDVETLRWAVRSDGKSGFVFVNNYERLKQLPAKDGVQFQLNLPDQTLTFPGDPINVPADACFLWPFNFDLGKGIRLVWATAQPVTAIEDGDTRTVFFAETPGVNAQFAFPADTVADVSHITKSDASTPKTEVVQASRTALQVISVFAPELLRNVRPSRSPAIALRGKSGGTVRLVLLNEADSLALWKGSWEGRERVLLSAANVVLDGDQLRLTSTNRAALSVSVLPRPTDVTVDGHSASESAADGVFTRLTPPVPSPGKFKVNFEQVQSAGPARTIPLGKSRRPVAAAPEDADFDQAAIWKIALPAGMDLHTDPLLRLHYVGDVARVLLDGKLINDDFYNGEELEIGLRRYSPEILTGDLRVAVLPLRKDAPIHLPGKVHPSFGNRQSVVALDQVEIVPRYRVALTAP